DLMNTSTGLKMAEERHTYMLDFLDRFYREWNPGK
ncbi:MAG: phosphohydrolase, partial [Bacteroidetes bacterium]